MSFLFQKYCCSLVTTGKQGLILWLTGKTAHIGAALSNDILGVVACSGFAVKSMTCKIANVSSGALQNSPKVY